VACVRSLNCYQRPRGFFPRSLVLGVSSTLGTGRKVRRWSGATLRCEISASGRPALRWIAAQGAVFWGIEIVEPLDDKAFAAFARGLISIQLQSSRVICTLLTLSSVKYNQKVAF
jgi:hypothetical protein